MSAFMPMTRARTAAVAPKVSAVQAILLVQGCYYLLTGLWAVLDADSFQRITGEKSDLPLVRTVSVLLVAIAGGLVLAARKPQPCAEIVCVAVATAAGLTAIDVVHVSARVLAPVYLIDAAAEVALLLWWGWLGVSRLGESDRDGGQP
jgi:hypothetical protein